MTTIAIWERDQAGRIAAIVPQSTTGLLTQARARRLIRHYMLDVTRVSAEFAGTPRVYECLIALVLRFKGQLELFAIFLSGEGDEARICLRRGTWHETTGSLSDLQQTLRIESVFLEDYLPIVHTLVDSVSTARGQICGLKRACRNGRTAWIEIGYSLLIESYLLNGEYFCDEHVNEFVEELAVRMPRIFDEVQASASLVPDANTLRVSYRSGPLT